MNNKKSFDDRLKEIGRAPFDADEVFGKEMKAYTPDSFVKADNGKLQWSLMPFEQLEDVVKVLMNGAKKYSVDNWKKCDDTKRYEDALLRHVVAYVKGDKVDLEDNISHLAHAVCNCLFLMYFDKEKINEAGNKGTC